MAHEETNHTDRRTFLQATTLGTVAAMSMASGAMAQDAPAKETAIPKRKLGKTGIEVTLLDQGAVMTSAYGRGPAALPRPPPA